MATVVDLTSVVNLTSVVTVTLVATFHMPLEACAAIVNSSEVAAAMRLWPWMTIWAAVTVGAKLREQASVLSSDRRLPVDSNTHSQDTGRPMVASTRADVASSTTATMTSEKGKLNLTITSISGVGMATNVGTPDGDCVGRLDRIDGDRVATGSSTVAGEAVGSIVGVSVVGNAVGSDEVGMRVRAGVRSKVLGWGEGASVGSELKGTDAGAGVGPKVVGANDANDGCGLGCVAVVGAVVSDDVPSVSLHKRP